MIISLTILAAALGLFYLYIFTMGVQRAWPELPLTAKVVVAPPVILAVLWDWLFNVLFASVLFLDAPASWRELLTARLKRYAGNPLERRWRMWIALRICNVLDTFDPSGDHC